ncbi:hypothetical protein FOA52_004602 [Chlamydomonas sp. UWO 241]|nr:hypothetical protein FOA52_004602 [Chlamydomonas sp. UWO 241]
MRWTTAALALLALAAAASAADFNGGVTNFPYCRCIDLFPPTINIIDVNVTESRLSFTIASLADQPLDTQCSQDIEKLEINTFGYCRFSKITAFINGIQVKPPVFDNTGSSNTVLIPEVQVLKLRVQAAWASVVASPMEIVMLIDPTPGVRKCTDWRVLLNTTGAPDPSFGAALFSKDNALAIMVNGDTGIKYACRAITSNTVTVCASGSPATVPVCQATTTEVAIRAYDAMGYAVFTCNMGLNMTDTCGCTQTHTPTYCMNAVSQGITGRGELVYTCKSFNSSMVVACARGSPLSTTPVCTSFPTPTNPFAVMNSLAGYENYTCNMQLGVVDTCGCTYTSPLFTCQLSLPPPPPSPPAPPPPPPFLDYPHSTCWPGNSAANRGWGASGAAMRGIGWDVSITREDAGRNTSADDRFLTFTLFPSSQCDPAITGDVKCCDMTLSKIELVIKPRCRGAIKTVTVPLGQPTPTLPSYSVQNWPNVIPVGLSSAQMTTHFGGLTASDGREVTIFTIELREDSTCNTVDSFLYDSTNYWFAVFGQSDGNRVNACCGTNTYPF